MFKYIVQRLIIFLPTLLAVSLVAFSLSKLAPGDPVELLVKGQSGESGQKASVQAYEEVSRRLGLDLPVFYGALTTSAFPDTLHLVIKKSERESLSNLISQYGNWPQISDYYLSLKSLEREVAYFPVDTAISLMRNTISRHVKDLLINNKDSRITFALSEIQTIVSDSSSLNTLQPLVTQVAGNYAKVKSEATVFKNYIPSMNWYGFKNQYHHWITNFFKGDFGFSYLDSRPVGGKMWDALRWTLIINFISIILAYLIAIPIGVSTAVKKDGVYDRVVTTVLFILYSLPSFWIGTLLIVFFTTSEYSPWLNWFPTGGVTDLPSSTPFFTRAIDIMHHLALPIFCVTYGSFAFISRQMRGGMLTVIRQDYIRTAKAKGLEEKAIVWKHAFRNSLFPIITLFAYIFPAAIAGAVTIEVIYSIPGMGKLAVDSIVARDWPVVFTILMFAAILTMIGNLVADLLYALVDPRVSYGNKK